MGQQEWERGQAERQLALSQANAAYAQNQPAAAPTPYEEMQLRLLEQEYAWNQFLMEQAKSTGVTPTNTTGPANARWTPYGYGYGPA